MVRCAFWVLAARRGSSAADARGCRGIPVGAKLVRAPAAAITCRSAVGRLDHAHDVGASFSTARSLQWSFDRRRQVLKNRYAEASRHCQHLRHGESRAMVSTI